MMRIGLFVNFPGGPVKPAGMQVEVTFDRSDQVFGLLAVDRTPPEHEPVISPQAADGKRPRRIQEAPEAGAGRE